MGSEDKWHNQSWDSGTMRWETNTKEKNKGVKFPFDTMGKGTETLLKEIRYCRHNHIKNIKSGLSRGQRSVRGNKKDLKRFKSPNDFHF